MKLARKIVVGCALGVVSAAVVVGLDVGGVEVVETFESHTWDFRTRLLAEKSNVPVKLILLDQESLKWGKTKPREWAWPWPREAYVPIIEFCKRGGAKAIAFDVLFTESSYYPEDDQRLGEAVAETPNFVLAMLPGDEDLSDTKAWPNDIPSGPFLVFDKESFAEVFAHKHWYQPRAVFSIDEIAGKAAVHGHVRGQFDSNHVIHRIAPIHIFDGEVVPALGLAAYATGLKPLQEVLYFKHRRLAVGDNYWPLDGEGNMILRFRRPRDSSTLHSYETYSAAGIIESQLLMEEGKPPRILPETFANCYVLFGFSAPALYDLKPTPFNKVAPGVEVHATLIDNLLTQQAIAEPLAATVGFFTFALAMLGGVWTACSGKAKWIVLGMVVLLPVPTVAGLLGYTWGYWWPVVVPQAAVLAAMVSGVIYNYATEGRQRRFIKQAFSQYLTPRVIERIVDDPSRLQLGGETRELTMFFSDLEKFSAISQSLEGSVVTALLNDYLTDMNPVIFKEDGTLDKYIGDAIVAFWNAPTDQPDHAARAVRAAIQCQRKLAERAAEFTGRAGGHPFRMRIGLHTGRVLVGNMGSVDRFNYTMLGDAANLASRLEGANKAFGTMLMVSHETWSQCDGQFIGREIGTITVVGRTTPVRVYEPLGLAGETRAAWVDEYELALELCKQGKADEALALFERLPNDPVSRAYVKKIAAMSVEERREWRGLFELKEKG